jgi:prepilin-type processing-associated H-X9-DG protein
MTQISDGTSNTIIVGEQSDFMRDTNGAPVLNGRGDPLLSEGWYGWTMGSEQDARIPPGWQSGGDNRSFNCTTILYSINQRGLNSGSGGTNEDCGANFPLTSAHTGGCNICMADGSVRFITQSIPIGTLQALATRNLGEVVTTPP